MTKHTARIPLVMAEKRDDAYETSREATRRRAAWTASRPNVLRAPGFRSRERRAWRVRVRPQDAIIEQLSVDCRAMQRTIFSDPSDFESALDQGSSIDTRLNKNYASEFRVAR
jgi:hypothetical protein